MMLSKNITLSVLLPLLLVFLIGCAEDTEAPTKTSQFLPETPSLTVPEIAEIALDSTVYLLIRNAQNKVFSGSGFVIREGLIATTYHQIDDIDVGSTARLVNTSASQTIQAVVAVNKVHDLAILQANITAPPLPLGDSDMVRIGYPVYVTGNPDGYIGSFSVGVIGGLRPDGGGWGKGDLIQITAPISIGSSGGPVLNHQGEVIGVAMGGDLDGQNLNFAIPVNHLKALLKTI